MTLYKQKSEILQEIKDEEEKLLITKCEISQIDADIDSIMSQVQETQFEQIKTKDLLDEMKVKMKLIKGELHCIEQLQEAKEKSLADCQLNLEVMQNKKETLAFELLEEMTNELSSVDQQKLDDLNNTIQRLERQYHEAFTARIDLETTKNTLENSINNNLTRSLFLCITKPV